jgi:hypothetical protein
MAEIKRTILLEYDVESGKLIDENGKVIQSVDQLGKAYNKTDQQQKRYNRTSEETKKRLKELDELQKNQARSAGLAGAATFELGRTISDLPFGIVAVTNNISQLGTLFAALVANAGSVGKAFKLLWAQIMGPAGILLAFQLITAAITFFAQRSDKAKKAANELSSSLREEAAALEIAAKELENGNLALEERLDILERYGVINKKTKEDLEEIGLSEEQQNELLRIRGELLEKNAALEARRKITAEGEDPEEVRKKALEDIYELETKLNEERKIELEVIETSRRNFHISEADLIRIKAKINAEFDAKLLENAELLRVARAKVQGSLTTEAEIKAEIFDLEQKQNELIEDRIEAQEELLKLEKERRAAISDLIDTQIQEQEAILDESVIELDYEKYRRHYARLNELKRIQLERQRQDELDGVTDKTVVNAIEEKYRILFDSLNKELVAVFKEGASEILKVDLVLEKQDMISLLDLLDTTERTEAQKWAKGELKKIGDAVTSELQKRVAETPALNGEGEGAFDFVKAFGMSKERIDAAINLAQTALSSINDVLKAQADQEIAIETNKVNALNDLLRERLANEQLSADERDKINQEIARNEAELVKKENEINRRRFEQEKAANISMAIIDTFSAATSVLATTKKGAFERIAGMIAVTAAGLANVAAIAKQEFVGKALPNPRLTGLGTAEQTSPTFNVVGASGQNQLAQAIEGINSRPIKTYVVSSDVSTAQELDRRIVEGASI